MENLWTKHASALAEAYVRSAGPVGFELVTRALLTHMPSRPQRVVDIGGGFGQQAIMLARAGHSVVIVDIDPNMISIAQDKLSSEPQEIRERVKLVHGNGIEAIRLVGNNFDLACCHSVLKYESDPIPILSTLVKLVHQGGLISILSINTQSLAMRFGLQGCWKEAKSILESGKQISSQYLPIYEYSREEVINILRIEGAKSKEWYGVGVFTDHITDTIFVEDPEDVYSVEWLAGSLDPYRQVARCFHLIAERITNDISK